MPNSRSKITTLLARCTKCEQAYEELTFRKLKKPIYGYFYWAICPVTAEPILMTMEKSNDPDCGASMHYV